MASQVPSVILEAEASTILPIEHSEAISISQPKLKGRARLIKGLQRISSSPSLAQFGRRRASSSPYGSRGSLSCVSLVSGSNPPISHSSHSTVGYSTSLTPVPTAPASDEVLFECQLPIRRVEHGATSEGAFALTSSIPAELKTFSKGLIAASVTTPIHKIQEDILHDGNQENHFSVSTTPRSSRIRFDFWRDMPHEIKLSIFAYLKPKDLVRVSAVNKEFSKICYDGQLWTCFDASEFYRDIPAEALAKIIVAAGPFVKDLNLRGCIQVELCQRAEVMVKACHNLINATLEGCRSMQGSTLHSFLRTNERLASLNLTGLTAVTNGTCKIVAHTCPSLEIFNVSWCTHMDARGIRTVVLGCKRLKDLRAGEIRGFDSIELAQDIFEANNLERLVLGGCTDLTDKAFQTMIIGQDPEFDILTGIALVPTRRLRHLDVSRCHRLTDHAVKTLANMTPDLQGLQLSRCRALTDNALSGVFATAPRLTHLDLEDLNRLTNTLLSENLAKAPCASILEHLSISSCDELGDSGVLPLLRACTNLRSIDMDNTKISDLVLIEAGKMVRSRSMRTISSCTRPWVGLRMVVFDCQNVTWTGIREVMSRNSEVTRPSAFHESTFPIELIGLKCFYEWQMTFDEHMKRILKGDLPAAGRLERRWGEYMMANEEAAVEGPGSRRRRRRVRQAQMMHADEEEGGVGVGDYGRRRRARSSGCEIM